MLTIRYSSDWKYNQAHAVADVCRGQDENGRILLVPEQRSFDAERLLCAQGGDEISRFAEVLSFTRLASRVLSFTGGCAIPTLENSGRLIAVAAALEQIRSRLKVYGNHLTKPEFLLQLLQIIEEFKSYGIKSETAAGLGLEGLLAQKMEELCLIVEAYEGVCSGAQQDPLSRLDLLADALCTSSYAEDRSFTVAGFTDFTGQELSVLEALLLHAKSITVYLDLDQLQIGEQLFSTPRQTAATLIHLAQKHGIPVAAERLAFEHSVSPLTHLAKELFAAKRNAWEAPAPELNLVTAQNAFEEAEYAAGFVQKLAFSGERYRDIAVVSSNGALYRPFLELAFSQCNIPCYFSGSLDLLTSPVLRAVLAALEAASTGMEPDAVSEYLKSGFSGLNADECDRLENYAFQWRLRGGAWDKPFTLHPDGFNKEDNETSRAKLQALERSRQLAILPLLRLRASLAEAGSTEAQVLALSEFLERINLEKQISGQVQRFRENGAYQKAQEYAQIYELLSLTMEQIYGVIGQTQRTPEEFFRFFRCALSQHSIGTIPATLDCVRIGDLSEMRGVSAKRLLILGADANSFPAAELGRGLLSDTERRTLKQAGLNIAPDSAERLDRSLLTIYTVMTAPSEQLYVSCVEGMESYLFSRLRALFPNCGTLRVSPLPVSENAAAASIAALQEDALHACLEAIPELSDAVKTLQARCSYRRGQLSPETVQRLYGQTLRLNASKIDKFASCRLSYFLKYGIHAKERRIAEVDAPIYGTLVHWVLENLVRQVMDEGGFAEISEDRLRELTELYIRQFVAQELHGLEENGARAAYLIERSFEEIHAIVLTLWDELRSSKFLPSGVEVHFAGAQAITVQGTLADCVISGFADRVDLYTAKNGQSYLRVIDYKTGRKSLDYTDLLNGVGLQMLIYLFALTDTDRPNGIKPAGVMYVPASYPVISKNSRLSDEALDKARKDSFRRSGMLLQNEEILRAMEPSDEPIYLPKGGLASAEDFLHLKQYVTRQIADMTDELFSGDLTPNPYERSETDSSCRFCEYKAVCHVAGGGIPVRKLKTSSEELFWEKIEQEVRENA